MTAPSPGEWSQMHSTRFLFASDPVISEIGAGRTAQSHVALSVGHLLGGLDSNMAPGLVGISEPLVDTAGSG